MVTATIEPTVTPDELADAIDALDDRLDVEADDDRRARLRRVRAGLERRLGELLAA